MLKTVYSLITRGRGTGPMKPDNQHFSLECNGVNSCRVFTILRDKKNS